MGEHGEGESSGGGSTGSRTEDVETVVVTGDGSSPLIRKEGPTTPVGASVGRYVVLEELGRGGMGRVLRAYDPKLQREVALKEVRRDVLAEELSERLVVEARAMAKLSHPNVVAVFDVEERGDDNVVLVMEYVAGHTLKKWLAREDRDLPAIVRTFVLAGRGLAAAHAAGLLHRDFKPSNVLVSERGTVKVTDFGLAKGVGISSRPSLDEGTSWPSEDDLTKAGTIMGTPRFMAPEQFDGGEIGPAVDQYAFCVALWHALCGEPPFAGDRMKRDKREGPPSWPNPRVPRAIARAITKGLAPSADDRWSSMTELLDALSWEPSRRRRQGTMAAAVVALVAVGGWQWWTGADDQRCSGAREHLRGIWDDARRAEVRTALLEIDAPYVAEVWERTERTLDEHAASWVAMHVEACEATTIRGEQSAEAMDLRMTCLQRAKGDLRATVDVLADADAGVAEHAHRIVDGLQEVARCADVEALRADVEPPTPNDAETVDRVRQRLDAVGAAVRAGRYARAKEGLDAARAELGAVEYGPVRAELAVQEGEVLERLGEYEAALPPLRDAVYVASRDHHWPVVARAARELMFVLGRRLQRTKEALHYRELALGLVEGKPEREAGVRAAIATVLLSDGDFDGAQQQAERALALLEATEDADQVTVAEIRSTLAGILVPQGKYERAEVELRRALEVREAELGPDHPGTIQDRGNLGIIFHIRGKYEAAEREHRRALALQEAIFGPEHPSVTATVDNLGNDLHAQGKLAEAEQFHRRALEGMSKIYEPENPRILSTRSNLAADLRGQHKYDEAEREQLEILEIRRKVLGPEDRGVAISHQSLADTYFDQEEYEAAEEHYRQSLELWTTLLEPDHPDLAMAYYNLASTLVELERGEEALEHAERAWARAKRDDFAPDRRGSIALMLADLRWELDPSPDSRARARELAEQAQRDFGQADGHHREWIEEARAWLAEHELAED